MMKKEKHIEYVEIKKRDRLRRRGEETQRHSAMKNSGNSFNMPII